MSPLPKITRPAPKQPMREPPGFDRKKAIKVESTGTANAPVYKVYSVNGIVLGAANTLEKAEAMRDAFPLEKLFL